MSSFYAPLSILSMLLTALCCKDSVKGCTVLYLSAALVALRCWCLSVDTVGKKSVKYVHKQEK